MLGEDGGWNCSILVSSEDFYCELLKLLKLKMKSRISLFLSESIIEFDSVPLILISGNLKSFYQSWNHSEAF